MANAAELPTYPLSTGTAAALLVFYALIYVVPLYASSTTRPSMHQSRDDPSLIRGRIRSVCLSCLVCSVLTFAIISFLGNGTFSKTAHSMGYRPIGVNATLRSLVLTAVLFLGPLYETGIVEGHWRSWLTGGEVIEVLNSWIAWRNLVIGPVTEEILFRSASVPLLLLSPVPNNSIIFLAPVIFGLSHVHHFYEYRVTNTQASVTGAVLRSFVQFSYTTLFGGYATFLYLRTGSLLSVIMVHSFCNRMGLPRLWGRVGVDDAGGGTAHQKVEEDRGKDGLEDGSLATMWSILYYTLLVTGAVAWWKLVWPLSESDSALATF